MESVGRLAAGVAHDFNNILTTIRANADFLAEDLPPDHPSRDEARQIGEAAGRASDLTRQLLAFGRKQVLSPTTLDLNDVVREIRDTLRRILKATFELDTELEDGLPPVHADRTQLEQILINLTVNAGDAMEARSAGGVEIRTEIRKLAGGETRRWGAPARAFT